MTHRFDELSKSLADDAVPRRETFRWLGAALAGAILGPLGLKPAWAARRDNCKAFCDQCPRSQRSQCVAACKACNNRPSRLCGSCGSYACCGNAQSCCGDYCADLDGDFYNCGECGFACEEPGTYEEGACIAGQCEYRCVEGAERCDGTCTFLLSDPDNCGACGNVCDEATPYCNQGSCSSINCPPGQTLCQGSYCADLYNDTNNCGACGNVCDIFETCTGGQCVPVD